MKYLLALTNKKIILMSVSLSFLVKLFEKYIFSDYEFLIFLIVIVSIDTVIGFLKAFHLHNVSSKGFSLIFTKFIVYTSLLILTHTLKHYTVAGEPNHIFGWIDNFIYSAIILREAISILENIAAIYPNLLPKSLLKRLKDFDQDGNLLITNKQNG